MLLHSTERGTCFAGSIGRTKEAQEEGGSGFTSQHLRSNGKAEKANQTFLFCGLDSSLFECF